MSSPDTLLNLFKEQLENESTALAKQHSLTKRGDLLIWWYFARITGLTPTEIDEVVCDGYNDLGVDAIWIDQDNIVHFYQFKNPENLSSGYPGGDVDKVLSGLSLILMRGHESVANSDLKGRIDELHQSVRDGYRLHLVTSGSGISSESEAKLVKFVEALRAPSQSFFEWKVEDIRGLQDIYYRKNLPTLEKPIHLDLDQTPYLVRAADHDSFIFHTTGQTLANLYNEHGEQLLQQNIRVFQGDTGTNALILQTATSDRSGSFFHFNNGVVFLCETGQWDGFTKKLTLSKAQVVNGGQTMRVLHSAFKGKQLRNDVVVPVRVITSQGDKGFASDVAVNLNNQTRIEPSFLRSNDPRVIQLSAALASMGWYLERREGETESLTAPERASIENKIANTLDDRVLHLKEASQAYVATYLRLPELAKKNPKRIFMGAGDRGSFERVFNHELTAEKFLSAQLFARHIAEYVKQFMLRKRRKDRTSDWAEDYRGLLGDSLLAKHSDIIDQVVPQCAVFITAVVFEEQIYLNGKLVSDLLKLPESEIFSVINRHMEQIIDLVKQDSRLAKSWPTLMKSQSFFETYSAFLKGRVSAGLAPKTIAAPG
jgi:hypothetical protein